MNRKIIKIIWGTILIALASLYVYHLLGPVSSQPFTRSGWIIICAVLSVAFFLTYFLAGIRHWVWLFPALISISMVLTLSGFTTYAHGPISPIPFLVSLAIPFYIGFFLNQKHWGLLIPAWALTVLPIIPPLSFAIDEATLMSMVLISLAIPFVIGYLVGNQSKILLFVTACLGFTGVFSLVDPILHGDLLAPVILLLLSLPFILAVAASHKHWWALIPAGIFASTGLVALISILLPEYNYILVGEFSVGVYLSLLCLGFAATFLVIWSLRSQQPTGWAIYPAFGCLLASILAFLMGPNFMALLPAVAFLVVGLAMLPAIVLKMKVTHQPSS